MRDTFKLFILFSFLLNSAICHCENKTTRNIFLWSVKHQQRYFSGFLFGTIHIPVAEIWNDVSDRVHEALLMADTVLLEVDFHNESAIQQLSSCKNLPSGQTARDYLPLSLYEKIDKFMDLFHINLLKELQTQNYYDPKNLIQAEKIFNDYAGNWWKKRSVWLLFFLHQMRNNMIKQGSGIFFDWYIALKAAEERKTIISIETSTEQCNPLWSVSEDEIVYGIEASLKELEALHAERSTLLWNSTSRENELVKHYKCGTLEDKFFNKKEIPTEMVHNIEEFRAANIREKLNYDIFTQRNYRMARRMDEVFRQKSNHIVFVAIGAGHFFGDNSVLRHLQRKGYIVQQIGENDKISITNVHHRAKPKFKRVWKKELELNKNPAVFEAEITLQNNVISRFRFFTSIMLLFFLT